MNIYDKRNFTQESLERIRSGKISPDSLRKRRLSRIILIVDLILVLLILIIFNKNSREPSYYSTSFSVKDIDYRASIARENESKRYIFSLTIKSNSKTNIIQYFNGYIANLELKYKESLIYNNTIGMKVNQLKLLPEEIKTFFIEIDDSIVRKFTSQHSDLVIPQKKTLFSVDKHIPLTGIITLNTKENITARINFNYMVE